MPFGGSYELCTYNGVTFSDRAEIVTFRAIPQYDKAGRTVTHVVYSFAIRDVFIASAGQTTDDIMNTIWDPLLVPGQELEFTGVGLGAFNINTSGVRDVLWGPRPQGLSYKAMGQGAMEAVWGCDVAIPACDGDAAYEKAIMEFNYRLRYEIDRAGYTRRIYSGYLRIPQTRGNGRNLRDNADNYFERIVPKLPVGYRLGSREREIDESKCQLNFSITHEQMGPNIPPPGVIDVQASHRVDSNHLSLVQYQGVISANYECDPATDPASCWPHFKQLCAERWAETKRRPFRIDNVPGGLAIAPIDFALPIGITFQEPDIYGVPRIARFSVTYLMFAHIAETIKAAGLFKQVEKSDWNLWIASIADSAFHARGADKLKFENGDDALVDLCLGGAKQAAIPRNEGTQQKRFLDLLDVFDFNCPDPIRSWISYRNKLEVKTHDNVIEHKPLPSPDDGPLEEGPRSFIGSPLPGYGSPQPYEIKTSKTAASTVHRRTENQNEVFLVGSALRACYDIAPPVLKSVGKNQVVQANRPDRGEGFWTWVVGWYGVPIIGAMWRIRYLVPTRPRQRLEVPAPDGLVSPRDDRTDGSSNSLEPK